MRSSLPSEYVRHADVHGLVSTFGSSTEVLPLEVVHGRPPEALDHAHLVAVEPTVAVDPGPRVERDRIDHERVTLPVGDLIPVVERLLLCLRLVGTSVRVNDAPVVVAFDQVHEQARLHDDLMRIGILIEHPGRPDRIAPDVRPGELDLLPGHALDLRRHFREERDRVLFDRRIGHDAPRIRLPRWAREPDAREIHLAIGHAGWRTTRGQRHGHDVAPCFNERLVLGGRRDGQQAHRCEHHTNKGFHDYFQTFVPKTPSTSCPSR